MNLIIFVKKVMIYLKHILMPSQLAQNYKTTIHFSLRMIYMVDLWQILINNIHLDTQLILMNFINFLQFNQPQYHHQNIPNLLSKLIKLITVTQHLIIPAKIKSMLVHSLYQMVLIQSLWREVVNHTSTQTFQILPHRPPITIGIHIRFLVRDQFYFSQLVRLKTIPLIMLKINTNRYGMLQCINLYHHLSIAFLTIIINLPHLSYTPKPIN